MIKELDRDTRICKDFVEGKLSFNNITDILKRDKLFNIFIYKNRKHFPVAYLITQIQNIDFDSLGYRLIIYEIFKNFLRIKKVDFNLSNNSELNKLQLYWDCLPSCIYIDDIHVIEKFIGDILNSEVSDLEKIKLSKNSLKLLNSNIFELAHWLQDPEWPLIKKKPLLSLIEQKNKYDEDNINYYWYNHERNEKCIYIDYYNKYSSILVMPK
jgi:hypothetical protein